jgi:hypothetical protein
MLFVLLVRHPVFNTSSQMTVLGVSGVRVYATLALRIEDRVNDPYFTTFTVLTILSLFHLLFHFST